MVGSKFPGAAMLVLLSSLSFEVFSDSGLSSHSDSSIEGIVKNIVGTRLEIQKPDGTVVTVSSSDSAVDNSLLGKRVKSKLVPVGDTYMLQNPKYRD